MAKKRRFYHVRIIPKSNPQVVEAVVDLSLKELETQFIEPHRQGHAIIINGKTIATSDLDRIQIHETQEPSKEVASMLETFELEMGYIHPSEEVSYSASTLAQQGTDVTNKYIVVAQGQSAEAENETAIDSRPPTNSREVFVIYGRNHRARVAMFDFLRAIGLDPVEWSEAVAATGKASPYIGEVVRVALSRAHAVVALFTSDDVVQLRKQYWDDPENEYETQPMGQPRPNVLYETGGAMSLNPDRTVLVLVGNMRPFSDIAGIHTVGIDKTPESRNDLAQRLKAAGCPVKLGRNDWLRVGDFEAAMEDGPLGFEPPYEDAGGNRIAVELSEDARELLLSGALDHLGMIQSILAVNGRVIEANGTVYTTANDPRSVARWERALQELLANGWVTHTDDMGVGYKLTHKGYAFADSLAAELR